MSGGPPALCRGIVLFVFLSFARRGCSGYGERGARLRGTAIGARRRTDSKTKCDRYGKSDGYGENDEKNRAKSPAFPDENGFRLADQRIILFAGQNVFLFANRNVSSVDLSARCQVFRAAPGSLRYFTPRSRSGSSTASSTGRGTSR